MRPTGSLHLGNYYGALKNWTELQYEYDCYFFIADYHALTTGYEDPSGIEGNAWTIVVDWLAYDDVQRVVTCSAVLIRKLGGRGIRAVPTSPQLGATGSSYHRWIAS